jgi:hypothetical protein
MSYRQAEILILLLGLGASACKTRMADNLDGFDCDPKSGICLPHDAGGRADVGSVDAMDMRPVTDAGSEANDARDAALPLPTLSITRPTSPAYTNGTLTVEIALSSAEPRPDAVELLRDGAALSTVAAPYTYSWDTTGEDEGEYELTARATFGSAVVTSLPVAVIVDRTPPEIRGMSPRPGATDVSLSEPIAVFFSEVLDSATTSGAITLSASGATIPTTVNVSTAGDALTVTLVNRAALSLPAVIMATFAPGLTDRAGNRLAANPNWSWMVPLWIKLPRLPGGSPSLALDSQDRPFVSTAEEQGAVGSGVFEILVARHGGTGLWDASFGSPQSMAVTTFVPAAGTIAVATDGQPILAWPEVDTGNAATIRVARWTGTGWDKRYGALDAVPGIDTFARSPSLAMGSGDALYIAWFEVNTALVGGVYSARWAGAAWELSYGGIGVSGASLPLLRLDGDGQPAIGWCCGVGSTSGVSRWIGTGWSTMTYPNTLGGGFALDVMNRPVVTSLSGAAGDRFLRVLHFASGAWIERVPALMTAADPAGAQLEVNQLGQPVVAWVDSDGGPRTVRVARHTGTAWDTSFGPLSGFDGSGTDAASPRLVLDRFGFPVVAWQETDGTSPSTFVWKSNH